MINRRAILIIVIVFVCFIGLILKLFEIQILRSEELRYYAQQQQMDLEKISAARGFIYDRNNVLMVYNREDISFYVDTRMAKKDDKKKIAEKFSKIFGRSRDYYLDLLKAKGKNVCIEKKAPSEKAILLKELKARGLFFQNDPTRVYQYQNTASHILGYTDNENEGVAGVEKFFNNILRGSDGSRLVEKNAVGDMMTIVEKETQPAVPGDNLILTIDKSIQNILDDELLKGLKKYGGSSAVGIIMDPNTGELLALSNILDYDPNRYWKYSDSCIRNKALTDPYEPGSTFKAFSMACLLDQKLCREDEIISVDNGKYRINNVPISDTHGFEYLTVKGILEQSSNVGISKLIKRIDDDIFYKYLRGFGFGSYTSPGLTGETKGFLKNPIDWNSLTKPFMSFGYEISVTPIQLITAFSALINGGIIYQPQILKKEIRSNGDVVFEASPKMVRTVISSETSARMRHLLAGVVKNGTGKEANLAIVDAGGKTGTSQKFINGSYSKEHYNASFIGFFPVENPRIICLILVNSPGSGKYGGLVAAPVFKSIAERMIKNDFKLINPPIKKYEQNNQQMKIVYAKQNSSQDIDKNIDDIKIINGEMPDLRNLPLRQAISILTNMGVKYKIKGSGMVISQSIDPGGKILKNSVCVLVCEEKKIARTNVY